MKKRPDHEPTGGPTVPSTATVEDLQHAVRRLADAEAARADAAAALARVRARGDGEAAVGMSVAQHLRWTTNLRGSTVTTLGVLTDVAADLPTVMTALADGRLTFEQATAIAWPASRVPAELRRALDTSLETDDGWFHSSPDTLEFEVERWLDEQRHLTDVDDEPTSRDFLRLQPTLDGQGLRGHFHATGIDAALISETLFTAADTPAEGERRGGQLLGGLLRILRDWANGSRGSDGAGPAVTLYAVVDERDDATGAGGLLTRTRGLAPRLSPRQVALLQAGDHVKRLQIRARHGELVSVDGRAGHTLDDPDALSEDTTPIICTVRDRTCRMPGCTNPILDGDLHHLIWKSSAPDVPDHPGNRAWLCKRCHHRVVHRWRWAGTVGALGRITWTRAGPNGQRTTVSTIGRLAQRLPRPPPTPPDGPNPPTRDTDPFGDPLPF